MPENAKETEMLGGGFPRSASTLGRCAGRRGAPLSAMKLCITILPSSISSSSSSSSHKKNNKIVIVVVVVVETEEERKEGFLRFDLGAETDQIFAFAWTDDRFHCTA